MSTFVLRINIDNAAFEDNAGGELARMLRGVAQDVDDCIRADLEGSTATLADVNGNKVGGYTVEEN